MDPPHDSPTLKAPDRTSSYGEELRASPARGGTAEAPARERGSLPPIFERLARPETQEEYFHGELRRKVPANPPHATQHFRLAYVLEAHVSEGYQGAVEMLTRTSSDTDFAPDASIFPKAPDESSRERQLEELAFEVCSEQDLSVPRVNLVIAALQRAEEAADVLGPFRAAVASCVSHAATTGH